MKKICILSMGCNVHTEEMRKLFKNLEGIYTHTMFPGDADVILAYFCMVTQKKVIDLLHELAYISNVKKPGSIFIAAGCMVNAMGEENFLSLDFIDYAVRRENFVQDVLDILVKREAENKYFLEDKPTMFSINIVGGCARKGGYCSFCKQNYLRIPVKSKTIDEVITIAKKVTKETSIGIIALQGLNTSLYGTDIGDGKPKLHTLIQKLSEIESVKLITVNALTIGDMYDELTEELASNPKINYLSFGIQSGHNKMHKIMNTHYTVEQIQYYLDKLAHKPIYTIVVPGHPGETEETVMATIDLIRKNNLWHIQVSPFVDTIATPSHSMKQLSDEEYQKYVGMVQDTVKELREDFLKSLPNSIVTAYFDEYMYFPQDDTAYIRIFPTNFHGTFFFSITNASKSKNYELAKTLKTGDKVKVHISKVVSDDFFKIELLLDKLEVF